MEEIKLKNTLTRELEVFKPIKVGEVGIYTCGPTVYSRAHIGNMRAYIFADVLRRVFEYANYKVKHVMNITDVGHLTSDEDSVEDKMQVAAKNSGKKSLEIAQKWTEIFFQDTGKLNIKKPSIICKATDYIPEQIELVKKLEEKGYTYITSDGVYFDTSKFEKYADFAKLNIEGLDAGKRISLGEKKNKTDFALWKFSNPEEKRDLEWDSPWGKGFPGWHVECSAMSQKHLGETFDIHTGGIDHIPVHHTNEIAQSECANGKKFVNYWLHSNFIVMSNREKMSKSKGNLIDLDKLIEEGISPLAYRYLCLSSHYRKQLIYGKEILDSALNSYTGLKNKIKELGFSGEIKINKISSKGENYISQFKEAIFNDLNTPQALAVLWSLLRDEAVLNEEKYFLSCEFDEVLALGIKIEKENIPKEIEEIAREREISRKEKNWKKSDELRDLILEKGYKIIDVSNGYRIEELK